MLTKLRQKNDAILLLIYLPFFSSNFRQKTKISPTPLTKIYRYVKVR